MPSGSELPPTLNNLTVLKAGNLYASSLDRSTGCRNFQRVTLMRIRKGVDDRHIVLVGN